MKATTMSKVNKFEFFRSRSFWDKCLLLLVLSATVSCQKYKPTVSMTDLNSLPPDELRAHGKPFASTYQGRFSGGLVLHPDGLEPSFRLSSVVSGKSGGILSGGDTVSVNGRFRLQTTQVQFDGAAGSFR